MEASDRLLNGRYEVLGVAGRGGEGTVLRALDRRHGRLVALKRRRTPHDPGDDRQFLLEARTLLSLRPHHGLPLARDDFFEDEFYFLVLDWVDGVDLDRFVAERGRPGVPVSTVLRWLAPVASALSYLHHSEPPIVHGDVKPANLILTTTGDVVLVDFGMSSTRGGSGRGGTLGFRPPDALDGVPTPAVDVYGLAATAFALLTGAPPSGVLPRWGDLEPERAARLEAALRRGMAIDPRRRTASPGQLIEELRSSVDSDEPLATGVLTYLSSDAVISGQLWQEHPHRAISLRAEHLVLVDRVLGDHRGHQIGDASTDGGITSVFGRPGDALEAAIALQRDAMARSIPVRCALDTGETVVDVGHLGATQIRVNRIREVAESGQILLSSVAARLAAVALAGDARMVELGPHRLPGFDQPTTLFAIDAPGIAVPRDPGVSPYPGLAAFQPDDAGLFFGREDIVADLVVRLQQSELVAVVGASGSGKSSLLRAGLAPKLPGAIVVTPTEHPLRAVESIDDDTPLIVDQFEELFTLCADPDQASEFVARLMARVGPCIVAIRADMYGSLAIYPDLAKAVAGEHTLLGAMTNDQLRRAITAPAVERGLEIEPGLVDLVISEVSGEPGILPHMAHALRETWLRREGRSLTIAGYRASGGVRGALAQTAELLFAESDPGDQQLIQRLLLRLVEVGDGLDVARRRVSLSELSAMPNGARFGPLITRLAASRLITIESETVEPAHEALLRDWPRLRHWIDDARDDLRTQRALTAAASEWQARERDSAHLYRGSKLADASAWGTTHADDISPVEVDFLQAGRQLEHNELLLARRTARRLKRLLNIAATLLVAVLGASVFAFVQRDNADSEARRATNAAADAAIAAQRATEEATRADNEAARANSEANVAIAKGLAAQATSLAFTDSDLSLLLAVEGFKRDDSLDTRSGILTALDASRHITSGRALGLPDSIVDAAYSTGTRALYVLDDDAVLHTIDPATGDHLADPVPTDVGEPLLLALSADGALLAVNGQTDIVLIDTATMGIVASGLGGNGAVGFVSPDRSQLLTVGQDRSITIVDIASGGVVAQRSFGDPQGLLAGDFLPDGTVIVTHGVTIEHLRVGNGELEPIATAEIPPSTGFRASPDGSVIVAGGLQGAVALLDAATLTPRAPTIELDASRAFSISFSPDGALFAIGGDDGSTTVFAASDGRLIRRITGLRGLVLATFLSNTSLVSLSAVEANGFLTDLDRPTILGNSVKVTESAYWIEPVEDGYLVQDRFEMRHVDAAGHSRQVISTDESTVSRYFDINPDQDLLVTTGTHFDANGVPGPSFIEIRRLSDFSVLHTIEPLVAAANGIKISPDGSMVAVGFANGTLIVYDTTNADIVVDAGVVDRLELSLPTVIWTDGGNRLLVGGQDGYVHVFDTVDWTSIGETKLSAGIAVRYSDLSPDGKLVAVPVETGQLFLLDAVTGDIVAGPLDAGGTQLQRALILEDNRTVVASSRDGTLRLWDIETGRAIGPALHGQDDYVTALAEVDGKVISVGGSSGLATTWDLDAANWVDLACRLAGRNLTAAEWATFVGDEPFADTCP